MLRRSKGAHEARSFCRRTTRLRSGFPFDEAGMSSATLSGTRYEKNRKNILPSVSRVALLKARVSHSSRLRCQTLRNDCHVASAGWLVAASQRSLASASIQPSG
jgi:hypothetical protein